MIVDLAAPSTHPLHRWERQRHLGAALAVAVVVAMGLLVLLATAAYGGTSGGAPDRVTVQPGDTLWSISAAHTDGDVRAEMDAITAANHLSSGALRPGLVLVVPSV